MTTTVVGATNSTGIGALLAATGSAVATDQDLTLLANQLPVSAPGLFFFGPTQIQTAFGDGFRCVGGATDRIAPLVIADASGRAALTVNFNAPYAAAFVAGAELNFQLWYRDGMAMASGFNLSDAKNILFQ